MTKKETGSKKSMRRNRRKPMSRSGPLTVREDLKDSDYVYRWVNDKDWNLSDKEERGYDFVEDSTGDMKVADVTMDESSIGKKVSKQVGNNTTAYLMRIPKEWYEEDAAEKRKMNNELENAKPSNPLYYDKTMETKISDDITK